jgi:malonyl-CoA/methylmalonyl-CoA synthetase
VSLELLERARGVPDRIAVVADEGAFTYGRLAADAAAVAGRLLGGRGDLAEERVALMVPPGYRYVAAQWGTWAAGGISVPLAVTHPAPELAYVAADADVAAIVASREYHDVLAPIAAELGVPLHDADQMVFAPADPPDALPALDGDRRCLILYTSGTTGRAKGVVWRHANLEAQLDILSKAWRWSGDDHALLVLPLHHVHGLVNVLTCALWNGAACTILPRFDAAATWEQLGGGGISVFMAVPTIYRRLIAAWQELPPPTREAHRVALSGMRLMVSGSAALPVPTLDAWHDISGHTLLERYGMTEIGMALSNSYEDPRHPGAVGAPLPGVEVRLVDDDGTPVADGVSGEIEVRGPSVFREYWRRPDATVEAFRDGWFRTGDVAVVADGVYRILGRQSVDIIKSGGEKVSALEIEEVLRSHDGVLDCAVIGLRDDEWGELVAAAVVPVSDGAVEAAALRDFARDRLAPAKVPRRVFLLDALPRNALGKAIKPRLAEALAEREDVDGP